MDNNNNKKNDEAIGELVSHLLAAQNTARMWHWKVKSFSQHMALGELYDGMNELIDDLMEIYMGGYGTETWIEISEPNIFSENTPQEFVAQLYHFLEMQHEIIPQDGFLVNKFEELQAIVARIKYKMENLA